MSVDDSYIPDICHYHNDFRCGGKIHVKSNAEDTGNTEDT